MTLKSITLRERHQSQKTIVLFHLCALSEFHEEIEEAFLIGLSFGDDANILKLLMVMVIYFYMNILKLLNCMYTVTDEFCGKQIPIRAVLKGGRTLFTVLLCPRVVKIVF